MRLAAALALIGVALFVFGVVLFTTGGCRVEPCGPSINEISFFAGSIFLVAAFVRFLTALLRRPGSRVANHYRRNDSANSRNRAH